MKENIIFNKLETILIQNEKIENWLEEECQENQNIRECILMNPDKSKILNTMLYMTINQDISYSFLVFKDENNRYRFLADGASEPARVMQKIDTDDKKVWDEAYSSEEGTLLSSNKQTDGLWLTYLSPFVENNQTYMMLVTDFSISLDNKIKNTISPIKEILLYILSITIVIFIIGIFQTIMYFIARKESFTDSLTGLNNRNYLRKVVDSRFPYAQYDIAIVDIDFFKKINDQYGHDIGDIVLKDISNIFKKIIGKDDFIFRYGGEEFLFLFQRNNSEKLLKELMSRVREHVININNQTIKFTISVGVNKNLYRCKHFTDMVKTADLALYNAKRSGRNKIVYYSEEINDEKQSSFQTVQSAIDENRVFCEYQAIIDTSSNCVFKYEALVRIKDTDGMTLYPNSFLEIIKDTNIYTDLTKKIIDISLSKFLDLNVHKFSINLGLQDFNNPEIINYVLKIIEKHPKLIDLMSIEVLEYDKVDDEISCIAMVKLLQDKGLKIALDDFGSGYANFSTILSYNFDFIKIDGSIIRKVVEDDKAVKMVQSILTFAQAHNIIVICEFVYSQEVYEVLKSIGVEHMQGYYLSKPSQDLEWNLLK
ncbi:MAG: bifunctional diguanylate cyclase/phosphodiesterase [Sulfurimonas sp.]|jgi:diguanylate cyclase (GGDEF)-like protein